MSGYCRTLPTAGASWRCATRGAAYSVIWLSTALPTARFGMAARICYPTGLTFGVWYRRWLELALRTLDNERRLVPRLRAGMTRAEVVAEVGGDWETRPSSVQALRYFEADDIPAQLVLDERDVVVEVRPWLFIGARP